MSRALLRAVAASALLALLCARSLAQLLLQGHVGHRAVILAAWKGFPARGKRIAAKLWEAGPGELPGHLAGQYSIGTARILLARMDEADTVLVFAHEWGHHVYYRALTEAERAAWGEFWSRSLRLMPCDYGRTSASEGFAESFAAMAVKSPPIKWGYSPLDPAVRAQLARYF